MNERPLLQRLRRLLTEQPFADSGLDTTVGQMLLALAVILVGVALLSAFARFMRRARERASDDRHPPGKAFDRTLYATVVVVTFLLTLEVLGIPVRDALRYQIVELGDKHLTPMSLLVACAMVVASVILSRAIRAGMSRTIETPTPQAKANLRTVGKLVHYVVVLLGLALALQHSGVDLTALVAVGGVMAIAIGFAMQNIAENFMSGVILLVERAVKPGDVLELEGDVVQVVSMGIRTTIVRTRGGEDIVVPNSIIVSNAVKNYTLRDSQFRLRTTVGVAYESDMRLVFATLRRVADAFQRRLSDRPAQVFLREFGSSTVDFDVCVWMEDPWTSNQARSDLNEAIWNALADEGITIAFPQLDVHLDEKLLAALSGRRSRLAPPGDAESE